MTRLLISDEVFFSGSLESGSIATRVQPIENIVEDFGQRSLEDKTSFGLAPFIRTANYAALSLFLKSLY